MDPFIIEILSDISISSEKTDTPFFIVGATARDLYFKSSRSTIDLDLAIQVKSWKSFFEIQEELLKSGHFSKSDKLHRILYFKNNYPVDFVPFGLPSEPNGIITWPENKQMTILGFEEAYKNCIEIECSNIKSGKLHFASPVGLVIMKLISWNDSFDRNQKDSEDLELIFSNYQHLISEEIYEHPPILESVRYDLKRSSIILLGKKTAEILNSDTANAIKSILENQTDLDSDLRLVHNMSQMNGFREERINCNLQMLNDFKTGFLSKNV
jgi:predicted nucleotidyltransferase